MMRKILTWQADRSRLTATGGAAVLLTLLWLGGCRSVPPPPVPAPEPVPAVHRGLIVLASDNSPAITGVARELALRLSAGDVESHTLSADDSRNVALLRRVQSSDRTRVVAIGLPAAKLARRLDGKQVVFCQVFNHENAHLVTPWMKGVAAVPPAGESLRAWKSIQPGLTRIGLVTGPNLKGLVAEARAAARAQGVELHSVEVRTDKELLYTVKRFGAKVQGLWLVPDNRVLSRHVLRDVVGHALKEGKSVLAFHRDLLAIGAMLSAESDAGDIADTVLQRIGQAGAGAVLPGAEMTPLNRAEIRVNALVVSQLGLSLPAAFRDKTHAH
jgi:ABC-type uncharacterized transport system substrate-binding protein